LFLIENSLSLEESEVKPTGQLIEKLWLLKGETRERLSLAIGLLPF
jgi:hypothetical protein